jgi:acyl carrier protein
MTRFRYDVVLHVDGGSEVLRPDDWFDWEDRDLSLTAVEEMLQREQPPVIGFREIPNSRVHSEYRALELIRPGEAGVKTVGDIREALRSEAGVAVVDPEDLWNVVERVGQYEAILSWAASGRQDRFDAVLRRVGPSDDRKIVSFVDPGRADSGVEHLTNDPQRAVQARRLAPELRDYLQNRLPAYMIPSTIMVVDELPLTPAGKVDRAGLPEPFARAPGEEDDTSPPSTDSERRMAAIWQEALGVDEISVYDNFFDLGGHSLLAMTVISKVEREIGKRFSPLELAAQRLGQLAALCDDRRDAETRPEKKRLVKRALNAMKTGLT